MTEGNDDPGRTGDRRKRAAPLGRKPERAAPAGAVPGAGGVVFDRDGRVLLLQHRTGEWVFPKGHIEDGETLLEAALREVEEESGVVATCPSPSRSWVTSYRNRRRELRYVTWFVCTTDDPKPHVTERMFRRAEFRPPQLALKCLSHAANRDLLEQILADVGPGGPAVKGQPAG